MNALVREFVDSISAWPRSLPWPQLDSTQVNWDQPTDDVGTLLGPTRFRLANTNASPSFEFEIQFTEEECENFEAWYDEVVALGGEMYLPWIGEGRIVYFTEYELSPVALGWKLHALAVQLYVDRDYCDRHVCDAAWAFRVPVIVDADANYPLITADQPSTYRRPRLFDEFFSLQPNARLTGQFGPDSRLTDDYASTDTFTADLGAAEVWNGDLLGWLEPVIIITADLSATDVWVGNTWGHDGNPGLLAECTDVVVASLAASNVYVDIPANWMWDEQMEEWYAQSRMTYVDDWDALWLDELSCRLLKDKLPQPYPIVENRDWSLTRIVSDNLPLETYVAC